MTESIEGQVRFLLATACLGMALMAGYDLLRLLRWLFSHSKLWIAAEDLLYWCAASVPAFFVFFIFNHGEIRWYGVLMVLLGGLLYEKGIGCHVRYCGRRYLTAPKKRLFLWGAAGRKKIFAFCTKRRYDKDKKKNGIR